jgi:hypothetical protein
MRNGTSDLFEKVAHGIGCDGRSVQRKSEKEKKKGEPPESADHGGILHAIDRRIQNKSVAAPFK